MTARILIVDDIAANRKLLEVRLANEYFEPISVNTGQDALDYCAKHPCDIILLDAMMPEMDGFEVCKRLKTNPKTAHIPVIMVTALDQPKDRVRGLEVGADEFLTKPIDEVQLIARVRSLARLKVMIDELRERAHTAALLDLPSTYEVPSLKDGQKGRLLIIEDRKHARERLAQMLEKAHDIVLETEAGTAFIRAKEDNFDAFIISLSLETYDSLRLCSQIRAVEHTRNVPILIIADIDDRQRMLRALDIGVNDCISRPIDNNELLARIRTQLRQRRYAKSLREKVQQSIELALVDSLTSLHNRRFFESHLPRMIDHAHPTHAPLTLMILDIDHFKHVNDTYGHDCGDEILKIFAHRLRRITRESDLLCRLGGEEFVIVMPNTDLEASAKIAARALKEIEQELFETPAPHHKIAVTTSIGLAEFRQDDTAQDLYRRADQALYRSKAEGRNRVSIDTIENVALGN